MSDPEFSYREYSEPVMTRDADGYVTADWSRKGYKGMTLMSDQFVDEWVATVNDNVRLRAELVSAQTAASEAERALRSLARSKVIGVNDDGSVWVFGGMLPSGTLEYTYGGGQAPVWKNDERYATHDSPFAATVRRAVSLTDESETPT